MSAQNPPQSQSSPVSRLESSLSPELLAALRGVKLRQLTRSSALDAEIYSWYATVFRQFVAPWYYRINDNGTLADSTMEYLQQMINLITQRLEALDLTVVVQDIARILDIHASDIDVAVARSKIPGATASVDALFLAVNPHPALQLDPAAAGIAAYAASLASELVNQFLPGVPTIALGLLAEVLKQTLGSVLNLFSQPWMIHTIIIKVFSKQSTTTPSPGGGNVTTANADFAGEFSSGMSLLNHGDSHGHAARRLRAAARRSRNKQRGYREISSPATSAEQAQSKAVTVTKPKSTLALFRGLFAETPRDDNPFLLWFAQHRVFQGFIASSLFAASWPLHGTISVYTNRILRNAIREFVTDAGVTQSLAMLRKSVFPDGYLGTPRPEPSAEEKKQLRIQANAVLPRAFGRQIVSIEAFDSTTINLRLVLSLADYVTRALLSELSQVVPPTPGNPLDPSNPLNPGNPSNPLNPGTPSNPLNPGTPSNPLNPPKI